jgi:excisionase family DNA binding protein
MTLSQTPQRYALSVSDFCEACSIGRSTFYEEVKAGRIRILKAGKRTLIASSEVQRWLDSLAAG